MARRITWWEWTVLALITLLAGALRWMQLADEGLWLDEAFSLWMARQPLGAFFEWIVKLDQHPPLYYLMLRVWLALGDNETTLRSLSALLGTATVPVLYLAGRRLFGAVALPCALWPGGAHVCASGL